MCEPSRFPTGPVELGDAGLSVRFQQRCELFLARGGQKVPVGPVAREATLVSAHHFGCVVLGIEGERQQSQSRRHFWLAPHPRSNAV